MTYRERICSTLTLVLYHLDAMFQSFYTTCCPTKQSRTISTATFFTQTSIIILPQGQSICKQTFCEGTCTNIVIVVSWICRELAFWKPSPLFFPRNLSYFDYCYKNVTSLFGTILYYHSVTVFVSPLLVAVVKRQNVYRNGHGRQSNKKHSRVISNSCVCSVPISCLQNPVVTINDL